MPKTLKNLTAEQRDIALLTLLGYGGNSIRAAAALKQQGITIAARTLRSWRESTYAERYLELGREHAHAIEGIAVTKMRETILQALSVQEQALEAAGEQIANGEARDPSAVARNAAVVAGINSQHNLTYTGRPTAIVQHDTVESILERLQAKHPRMFIDSTAEETPTVSYEQTMREIERRRHPDE